MIANRRPPLARVRGLSGLLLPVVLALSVCVGACRGTAGGSGAVAEADPDDRVRRAIEAVLDDFHHAASEADEERYFAHQAEGSVFLGTDATERWPKPDFQAYARPFFGTGRGWTYVPMERHVYVGADGRTAWFDERLFNEKYGETRGTGVLVLQDGTWRLAQYNLTIPVPNDLALDLVERIRQLDQDRPEE